jgi:predicted negative regulator of RcsB-dependent stress response
VTRQRLTKRQIREDPLLNAIGTLRSWATHHSRHLLIAGAVVLLVVIGAGAMRNARRAAESEATTQLSQAQYNLWGQNPEQAIQVADDIEQRWPGTRSARLALLVKADALYQAGQLQEALTAYDGFIDRYKGDDLRRTAAMRGKAATLEDLGRYAEAAVLYEQLARNSDAGAAMTGVDLIAAARCRAQSGDVAAARELYEEVLEEHPDLQSSFNVRLKLLELDGAAAAQG